MEVNGNIFIRELGFGEFRNAIIERVNGGVDGGSLPTGKEGRIVFNQDSDTYWFYGGGQWNEIGFGVNNIINSGGFMNADGTFNSAAFSEFTNITLGSPLGSPANFNLIEALIQLDAAITSAVGIDTLEELSDVTVSNPQIGDVLYLTSNSPDMWATAQPGVVSGVQSFDAGLTSIANLSLTINDFLYVSSSSPETFDTFTSGTVGRSLLGDETVGDVLTTLGLNSGDANDIWVDIEGDTIYGDLILSAGAGSPNNEPRIQLTSGAVDAPPLTFVGDTNTGLYRFGADRIALVTGGADRITIDNLGAVVILNELLVPFGSSSDPSYTFSGDTNSGSFLIETDIFGITAGGSERLRVYGKDVNVGGSPIVTGTTTGAISVQSTANYEALIGDPADSGFLTPVDDFLPNAQWVDLYYLRKSGGTLSGDIVMNGNNINMSSGRITSLSAPLTSLDATNKNYVDNLVASGTVWVNPIRNPDLVGISADEVLNPLPSGAYIAYGGTYPQFWATDAGSPATGSPQFIEVNEYDVMHFVFGVWERSTNLLTGFSNPRFGAGIFTNALDSTPGQNFDGTGILENDLIEYIGTGSPNNPFDPDNWIFPHGRVGGVTFDVVSVTSSTKTFVIDGDHTRSLFEGNKFVYSGSGSPGGAGSPQNLATTYTIDSVTLSGSPETTLVTVDEDVVGDGVGGYIEPELTNGITTLTSNSNDSHFGQSYLYVASTNEWVQISGPGNVDDGVGLSYQGNTLNVNLGAGIFELPNDEVGIELYTAASGALILTEDGTSRDNTSDSRLHILLSAVGGLDQGVSGLFISAGGVTNAMLENSFVRLDDGVNAPDEVSLGEDVTLTGGIASGSNALKFRRIEDADSDTYIQTSDSVNGDEDQINLVVPGGSTVTIDSALGDITLTAASSVELDASTAVEVLSNIDLRLMDVDNTHYIGHKSNAVVSSSITYEWPEAPLASGYVLTSTTGGVMSWVSPNTIGRTRLENLDDVQITPGVGSPNVYTEGDVLVASGGSPNVFENQQIQYIYDSTLTGSPSANTTHIINHNIGQKYVGVHVYDTDDNEIIPDNVKLNSSTQTTITFDIAIDCIVVIIGVPGVEAKDGS